MKLWSWGWFRFTPGLTPGPFILEPDRTLVDLDGSDEQPVEEWVAGLAPDPAQPCARCELDLEGHTHGGSN